MTNVPPTILVVDDVEDWRKTLTGLLTDEGYRVAAVGNRRSALEAVNTARFDLALIDVRLDESDEKNTAGLSLAEEIKKIQAGLPVIIITGYETTNSINRALKPDESGQVLAVDFVLKMDTNQLIDIVNHNLKSIRL
jgi:CheY-like chemotaxis protein